MKHIGGVINKRIKFLGNRTCDVCGSSVPVYERNGERVSVCMTCENIKLKQTLPKKEDVERVYLKNFIESEEVTPEEIAGKTFHDYKPADETQKKAKKICQRYADIFGGFEDHHSLVIQGNPGLGKSHLSYCINRAVREKGFYTFFIDAPNLMRLIRGSYSDYSTLSENDIFNHLEQLDLLVLDDIGAEYVKVDPSGYESWAADVLFRIVNARQDKPTIFTTNYSSAQLREKYGQKSTRILSRMYYKAHPIKLEGKDYRLGGDKDVQR